MKIGWFMGNGRKYKLYVTDEAHVLLIPTRKGYPIAFSTTQAEAVIDELRRYGTVGE